MKQESFLGKINGYTVDFTSTINF